MRIHDTAYSRAVAAAKILAPLLALALLSTLFLVSRTVDPAQRLPFADVDIDEIAREERIGAPDFAGVTPDGVAIALSARTATPDSAGDGQVTGEAVLASVELPSGERIEISANRMELDFSRSAASLSDSVAITSDAGFSMSTGSLEIALDRTGVRSRERTTMRSGFGEISADGFELVSRTGGEGGAGGYLLAFRGDVRLRYVPERQDADE